MRRDAAVAVRLLGVVRAEEWAAQAAVESAARSFPMAVREVRGGREVQVRGEEALRPRGIGARAPSLFLACRLVLRDDGGMTRDLPRA